MTIRTAIQDFLVEIEIRKYTIKTQRGYKTNLNVFVKYCEEELQITDMDDLDMMLSNSAVEHLVKHRAKGVNAENVRISPHTFRHYAVDYAHDYISDKANKVLE